MAKLAVGALLVCFLVAVHADTKVYTDAVLSPFQDWGWGTKNAADTAKHYAGTASYSFAPNNYNAAYFYHATGFSLSSYSKVTFWVYRTGGDTNIYFNLVVYNGTSNKVGANNLVTSYISGGTWNTNTWTQVTVTLSTASFPSQTYNGFWLQYGAAAPASAYTVYIDEINLVSSGGGTATSAPTVKGATSAPTTVKAATTVKGATSAPTVKGATAAPSKAPTSAPTTAGGGSGTPNTQLTALYSTTYTGEGTYYGVYSNGGNCQLDPTPPDGQPGTGTGINVTVAIADYFSSGACGMCLQVTGTGQGNGAASSAITGTRLVYVNNRCPSCNAHGLDFALAGDGVWTISWKAVPCPNKGNIQYIYKSGSSQYWIGLQPRNAIVPVNKLELYIGGSWVSLPRDDNNYFLGSVSGLTTPFQVRLTSIFGEQKTETLSQILSDQVTVVTGTLQFSKTS